MVCRGSKGTAMFRRKEEQASRSRECLVFPEQCEEKYLATRDRQTGRHPKNKTPKQGVLFGCLQHHACAWCVGARKAQPCSDARRNRRAGVESASVCLKNPTLRSGFCYLNGNVGLKGLARPNRKCAVRTDVFQVTMLCLGTYQLSTLWAGARACLFYMQSRTMNHQ